MNDLWPDFEQFDRTIEENNAIEILKEQARILSKKTNGKIKATFSKIKRPSYQIADALQAAISNHMMSMDEEEEDELKGKKDANQLYIFVDYKFEIYNETYKFRVFTLKYRPIYPLEIEIDEGIKKECGFWDSRQEVKNDDDLIEIITSIFSSKKLQTIIRRVMADEVK